jgi:dihydrofolate reductase
MTKTAGSSAIVQKSLVVESWLKCYESSRMQVSVFIATSLGGFIARKNGDIDWLPGTSTATEEEDYGYQAFFESVDAIAMGHTPYELVSTLDEWPYGDKPVIVLSHHPIKLATDLMDRVEVLSAPLAEVHRRLSTRGIRHL